MVAFRVLGPQKMSNEHEVSEDQIRWTKHGLANVQLYCLCSPPPSLSRSENHWLQNATLMHRSELGCLVHLEELERVTELCRKYRAAMDA